MKNNNKRNKSQKKISNGAAVEKNDESRHKMILCVNERLNMGMGKIAAQCCHAAVGCYKTAKQQSAKALHKWEKSGSPQIALKCPDEEEMDYIASKAQEYDIPVYFVTDAGRTEVAAGSRTVLGLGPAPEHVVDKITSHLKLL